MLLSSFSKKAPNKVFIAIILGAIAGVLYSALIPLVLSSIQVEDPAFRSIDKGTIEWFGFEISNFKMAALFAIVFMSILLMRTFSEILLVRVSADVAKDIRTRMYQRILEAPLSALEQMGSSRLIAGINVDVPRIVAGARALPQLIINGITLVGMLAFLMYLNFEAFKLVMMAIAVGILFYQGPMIIGRKIFERSRESQDKLQESIRGLIQGSKELKLDSVKKQTFFEEILCRFESEIQNNDKKAQTIVRATISFGDLISFFVIGCVTFIFVNYHSISQQELIGVIMALLYVTGPIAVLLSAIPVLTVATISYKKLNRLLSQIPKEDIEAYSGAKPEWQSIRFQDVEYQYESQDEERGFSIGPLSFEVKKGEITFLIGANGSGKSTLSKLLTLHYSPSAGAIAFDGVRVTQSNIAAYRQQISAIYTDYFLFERLLIDVSDDIVEATQQYLSLLHLQEKVSIVNGQFSTLALSDGQRKRLALLVSFLEDKELYLFDEWAADQDPLFKRVFYTQILPELKAKGKAIIVISHDDRFFHVADKVLTMVQGQLSDDPKLGLTDLSPVEFDTISIGSSKEREVIE